MPAFAAKMELKRVTVLFLKTLKSKKDVILFAEQLKNLKCSRLIISDYFQKNQLLYSILPGLLNKLVDKSYKHYQISNISWLGRKADIVNAAEIENLILSIGRGSFQATEPKAITGHWVFEGGKSRFVTIERVSGREGHPYHRAPALCRRLKYQSRFDPVLPLRSCDF